MEANANTNVIEHGNEATVVAKGPRVLKDTVGAKMSQAKPGKVAVPNLRQPLGDGETAKSEFTFVDATHAKVLYSFKLDKDATDRYQIATVLDFTGCSPSDILEAACKTHVITLQRQLRAMGKGALNRDVYVTVNVKRDLVEAQRTTMDGETRDLHAFARAAGITDIARARTLLAKIAAEEAQSPK